MNTLLFSLLTLVVASVFVVRFLRLLAFFQQKEYRFDRLAAFLKTDEGKQELLRIFPTLQDFSRTGLKRPVVTGRAVTIAGVLLLELFAVLQVSFMVASWFGFVVGLLVSSFILPVFLAVAVLPSMVIAYGVTLVELSKANALYKKQRPVIIGITGSYGKSSSKWLVGHVLSQAFDVFVPPRSFNTKYSVAKAFRSLLGNSRIAVLEYGAYTKGEIKELVKWLPPDHAIITGLTEQHLDLFGSKEAIISAKSELVAAVPEHGVVFCAAGDPGTVEIAKKGGRTDIVKTSGKDALEKISSVSLANDGTLSCTWRGEKIQTHLIGKQYVSAIQTAISVGLVMGLSAENIIKALKTFEPSSDIFISSYALQKGAVVIDDGRTANKVGYLAALDLVDEIKAQRKVLLIASGVVDLGESSHRIHTELAKRAKEVASQVWFFGEVGLREFEREFLDLCNSDVSSLQLALEKADENTVILIEGRVPKAVQKVVQRYAQ